MEWFPNRFLGRSKPKADALAILKSKTAARSVLDELARPVTSPPKERWEAPEPDEKFSGFRSPPGRF